MKRIANALCCCGGDPCQCTACDEGFPCEFTVTFPEFGGEKAACASFREISVTAFGPSLAGRYWYALSESTHGPAWFRGCPYAWQEWHWNGQLWWKGGYANGEKEGEWQRWWDNGQLYKKGMYVNGKEEGEWQYWHDNGQLMWKGVYANGEKEGGYANGKKEGEWHRWYSNGQLREKGVYRDDRKDGEWSYWDGNGIQQCVEVYHNGELVTNQ